MAKAGIQSARNDAEHEGDNLRVLAQAALYRQARERACLTRGQVVRYLGWPLTRLVALERGAASPTNDEALALTHLYVVGPRLPEGSTKRRAKPARGERQKTHVEDARNS